MSIVVTTDPVKSKGSVCTPQAQQQQHQILHFLWLILLPNMIIGQHLRGFQSLESDIFKTGAGIISLFI